MEIEPSRRVLSLKLLFALALQPSFVSPFSIPERFVAVVTAGHNGLKPLFGMKGPGVSRGFFLCRYKLSKGHIRNGGG